MVSARLGIAQRVRVRKWCRGRQRQRHDRVVQRQTVAKNDRAHVISSAQPVDVAKSARSPEEGRGRYRRPGRRNRPGGSRLAPHRSLVPRPRRLQVGTQRAERKKVARSSAVSSAIRCWTLSVGRLLRPHPFSRFTCHLSLITRHFACATPSSLRSRRRRAIVASLDAALEETPRRGWRRRDVRLSLYARKPETSRSSATTDRRTSSSAGRSSGKNRCDCTYHFDRQKHGRAHRLPHRARRKSGWAHLSWLPALRDGRPGKIARRSFARPNHADPLCARHARLALPVGPSRARARGNEGPESTSRRRRRRSLITGP